MKTKFALIDNVRTEAIKGAKGICPFCGSELIAKCGDIKLHHWAHKGIRTCDLWWENETEWHRTWKSNFNPDWQEIILHDKITGEKHIADVRTEHGLVIEFQHSFLNSQERIKRENFYKNMVWVIDGTRLKSDYLRFLKGKTNFRPTVEKGRHLVDSPDKCFPSAWIGSLVHVVFDFKGVESIDNPDDCRNYLYYLFPKRNTRESEVAILTRDSFINNIIEGKWFKQPNKYEKQIEKLSISSSILHQKQSPYVLHRGRFVKRKRL